MAIDRDPAIGIDRDLVGATGQRDPVARRRLPGERAHEGGSRSAFGVGRGSGLPGGTWRERCQDESGLPVRTIRGGADAAAMAVLEKDGGREERIARMGRDVVGQEIGVVVEVGGGEAAGAKILFVHDAPQEGSAGGHAADEQLVPRRGPCVGSPPVGRVPN